MNGHQADYTIPGHRVRRITGIVAGANASLATPIGFTAHLHGLRISFQTDVTAVNRLIRIHNFQNPAIAEAFIAPLVQPANSTWTYYFGTGLPVITGTSPQGIIQAAIPDYFIVRPGDVLQSAILNLQAADHILIFEMAFTEWLTD